jgi:tetratricopeptide (TPR) repeat protein
MNILFKSLLSAVLVCLPLLGSAAAPVPDNGLKAEIEGRWLDAITIYQKTLKNRPAQPHLWLRIADIQTHLNDNAAAITSLQTATQSSPRNAELFFRLSQLHASNDDKEAALLASNRAVELAPDNTDYLKARASHANWNGDYLLAQQSYRHILSLNPADDETTLSLARSSVWLGDNDSAVTAYRTYLEHQPENGEATLELMEVEAERGDYPAATRLAEGYRQRHGESLQYWLRVADLYVLAGNDRAAADALNNATRYSPDDAALYFRIARGYTDKEDVPHAIAAIDRALELEPENLEYLQARADLAAWGGDYAAALDSYHRILAIVPNDSGAMLGIARVNNWQGNTDRAIKGYKAYLEKHPKVQVAWVEYIRLETEIGHYAYALQLLEQYRGNFGETTEYVNLKARTYAWAARPASAMPLITQRLAEADDDYEMHYTRTIALNNDHRPAETIASLDKLIELHPDSKDTLDIQKYVKTPLRSHINLNGAYQSDSNDILQRQLGLEGVYVVSPQTRLSLGGEKFWIEAPLASGYENINGEKEAQYQSALLGAQHLVSPTLSVDLNVGMAHVQDGDNHGLYAAGVDIWPQDGLSLRLSRSKELFAVSPRALSLQISQWTNQLDISWSPDLNYTIDAMISRSTLSDNNERWEQQIAPRRAIVRNQHWNLDLGISGQWLGYKTDPGHGYYAPDRYERYALNAYAYRKFSEDNALSITASAGGYTDDNTDGFGFSGSLSLEAYIGLYRDWMLDVRAGLFENSGVDTGAYRINNIEFILTKRF